MIEGVNYENLSIIIVAYNPTQNIEFLLGECCKIASQVIIVDNNSRNNEWIKELSNRFNILYIRNTENFGIGKAINIGRCQINNQSKRWILTFDQDSCPPKDLLSSYNYVIKQENNIGLIGINFNSGVNKGGNNLKKYIYHESLDQITSGLLHNIEIFDIVGKYNEKLFIDCVDFEYSLRVRAYGFKTIMILNCFLDHTIGSPKTITIGRLKIQSMNHSAFRQYYIVRNHIWIAKKYFRLFPKYILNKFYHLFIRVAKTMLFDDYKQNKIKRICKGFIDGIKMNMD
ncbi:glycosyltransferase [Duncaniella freteri]|uniref:glycosyltransferase n=2 Tax=Duncaniella TaxID=2518495 RepID=UPI0025746528|nr:glycosyltransferase [Duncaniella freteri]